MNYNNKYTDLNVDGKMKIEMSREQEKEGDNEEVSKRNSLTKHIVVKLKNLLKKSDIEKSTIINELLNDICRLV